MRSYIMSLTLVACVLGGYTAMVMKFGSAAPRPTQTEVTKPTVSAETEPREPANAASVVN